MSDSEVDERSTLTPLPTTAAGRARGSRTPGRRSRFSARIANRATGADEGEGQSHRSSSSPAVSGARSDLEESDMDSPSPRQSPDGNNAHGFLAQEVTMGTTSLQNVMVKCHPDSKLLGIWKHDPIPSFSAFYTLDAEAEPVPKDNMFCVKVSTTNHLDLSGQLTQGEITIKFRSDDEARKFIEKSVEE